MKIIATRAHAALDYVAAVCMYGAAMIWKFDAPSKTALLIVAFAVLIYSLCTRYEVSVFKLIPIKAHLVLDILGGLALIVCSFLFMHSEMGFRVTLFCFGLMGIVVAAMTNPVPRPVEIPLSTTKLVRR